VSRRSVLALVVALAACSQHETTTTHVYDPYAGPPVYPSTRAKVAYPAGDFALVPASGADRLVAVDLGASQLFADVPVGRSPFVLDGPHQIVADLARRVAYVVHAYPDAIASAGNHSHGTSQRPGWVQVLALDDLHAVGEVRTDPNPGELAVSDDGKRLVVTHYDLASANRTDVPIEQRRSTLALIDPSAILPFGTPEPDKLLVCVAPHGLTLSRPDGNKAFVACYGEDALAIVDLADTHTPVVLVPTGEGSGPYGVALSPDGTRIAIGMRSAKTVRFLDVASSTLEPLSVNTLGESYVPAWSADGARLYVPTRALDAVAIVDAKTGATTKQRVFDPSECVAPIEVVVRADAYVVCEGTTDVKGAIVTLDAETLATKARVEVAAFPGRPFVGRFP
jgi:DNA-binding beta-propeller fold protein YncE